MNAPRKRVVHVGDCAVVDGHAVVGGYAAWWLGSALSDGGCLRDELERQLAVTRVPPAQRNEVLLAVDALVQAGGAWRVNHAITSTSTSGSEIREPAESVAPSERDDRLTARETGLLLHVSDRQVRLLASRGVLPGTRDAGGRWTFDAGDIQNEKRRREMKGAA